MNMYQELNREYRAFKESEELNKKQSLKESEETNDNIVVEDTETSTEETPVDNALTESEKTNESEDSTETKELEDRIGSIRARLEDDDLGEDEKEQLTKELSELENKLNECTSTDVKECEGQVCKECGKPVNEGQEVCNDCSTKVTEGTDDSNIELDDNEEVNVSISEVLRELLNMKDELNLKPKFVAAITSALDKAEALDAELATLNSDEEQPKDDSIEDLATLNSDENDLVECEVKGSRIIRISPSAKAFMIEAETTDGIKYFVGKNYNETTKVLEEAEQFNDKTSASNHFKTLLVK